MSNLGVTKCGLDAAREWRSLGVWTGGLIIAFIAMGAAVMGLADTVGHLGNDAVPELIKLFALPVGFGLLIAMIYILWAQSTLIRIVPGVDCILLPVLTMNNCSSCSGLEDPFAFVMGLLAKAISKVV